MDEEEKEKPKHRQDRRRKKFKIIIMGLIIHCLLLSAVFDIYFASPLEQGMAPIKSTQFPPAKRLVLFVADGLRAEAIYGHGKQDLIPFLSTVVKNKGSWGVSHTRVPTESRPGHVALLGGIYEDPSAIMKGWKANPVYFDSVVNESTNAWCWGSPDIITVFNSDNLPHIRLDSYGSHIQDFGRNDTGILDTWVFEKVESFLKNEVSQCEKKDCDKYYASGNFFFLHLLGIDTAGHGYKPHSVEYKNNIRLVDKIVETTSKLFADTFRDHSTAFVFTSDHGMTDWGSHGDGTDHETEAPLIVWGAGLKANPERQDVNQIDLAPFMSSLIGLNIPTNSLGKVPLYYLDVTKNTLSDIQLSNTLQLLEIFKLKRAKVANAALVHIPYKGISSKALNENIKNLYELKNAAKFNELIKKCDEIMELLISGIDYYHNYYQYPLLIAISLGFLGWILLLLAYVVVDNVAFVRPEAATVEFNKYLFTILILISIIMCFKHNFPVTYYFYFSFPLAMLFTMFQNLDSIFNNIKQLKLRHLLNILVYIAGLELLVYGFYNRFSISVLSIFIGLWIYTSKSLRTSTSNKEKLVWLGLCLTLAIFPTLPVMKTTFNLPMYLLGCCTWIILFYEMFCRMKFYNQIENFDVQYKVYQVQFLFMISAIVYVLFLEKGLISNDSSLKYIALPITVVPVALIPVTSKFVAARLVATFFAFAPFYLLVSSNYEAIFSAFYVAVLSNWLILESNSLKVANPTSLIYHMNFDNIKVNEAVNAEMFRRAFLFMVFVFVGFFGTGNIASLNSFDPMWVRAFLTVFSPFKMMGLILLKIMVPFIFSCCIFRAINSIGKENILKMFCIILVFADLMVLHFLYLIQNTGSWLDIGMSLSHFVIMEGFVTILLLLYGLAHIITTVSY